MTNGLDLARSGDAFMGQLAHALSQQTPEVAAVLERELFAGNWSLDSSTGDRGRAAPNARLAAGSNAWPAAVSETWRLLRTKRSAPSSASSVRIDADSPDWTIATRSAARVKCRSEL